MGRQLAVSFREGDVIGRIAEARFAVVAVAADEEARRGIVARVRDQIASSETLRGSEFPVAAALGSAMLRGAEDVEPAIAEAEWDLERRNGTSKQTPPRKAATVSAHIDDAARS